MPPPFNPMPTVEQVLAQQRRPGVSPLTAPAGAPARRAAAGPNLLNVLGALLAGSGSPTPPPAPAQDAPVMPAAAQPAPPAAPATPGAAALEQIIDRAIANPESETKGLYLSADELAGLAVDAPTLQAVVARNGLIAAQG